MTEVKRCAIYTRKSSEEGLDQAFNSLDAQREACEAYVKSQKSEGWRGLPAHYDDGGYSGGTMDRPGLTALLAEIAAGRIDVVVVYKIDRLTRSLADFARMVEQNLRDVPRGMGDMAMACGASPRHGICKVLVMEALPSLLGSLTVTATGFIAYSAVAGAVGAGGLGDLAIRYGYYRFETAVMIWCVIIMFVLVQLTQLLGDWLVRKTDKR